MSTRRNNWREQCVAVLSTLHVGIEPAFLGLLAVGGMPLAANGWMVGAGQLGMSAGAFLSWRSAAAARQPAALGAALLGGLASLGLAGVEDLGWLLLLRLALGVAMGLLFARATAIAACGHAHRAVGTIVLGQQLLAVALMIALPMAAARWGAGAALATLAMVPAVIGLLVAHEAERPLPPPPPVGEYATAPSFAPNLVAMSLLLAVTLMVWSYIGALGRLVGVSAGAAGVAIAVTSLASAPAALLASFTAPRHKPWVTALACGTAMVGPLLLPHRSGLAAYVAALTLFNAGSTFAMVRFSGWTMDSSAGALGRRKVVLVQCLSTACGAPLGAVAVAASGLGGLTVLAVVCTAVAVLAPLLTWRGPGAPRAATLLPVQRPTFDATDPMRPVHGT